MLSKFDIEHISLSKVALQLALCYTIGFGTSKDDRKATSILRDHSLNNTNLSSQIQLIIDDIQQIPSEDRLFATLQRQETVESIDFPEYYRGKELLERVEIDCKLNLQNIQLVFDQSHRLYLFVKFSLASLYMSQGRWKEAKELQMKVMKTSMWVLGKEHPDTLNIINNLAVTFSNQGRWKEAEELQMQVMNTSKKMLGEKHPNTLKVTTNLTSTYKSQER